MSEESTTPDLVDLTRRLLAAADRGDFDAASSFYVRTTAYTDIEEARAAAERLAEERR